MVGVGPPGVGERKWESSRWNVPLPPTGGALHTSVAAAVPERSDFNFGSGSETLTCGSGSFPRVPARWWWCDFVNAFPSLSLK